MTSNARPRTPIRGCLVRTPTASAQLGARPIILGAGRECDLVVDDAKVSRKHAELTFQPDGILVKDLGSSNGTFFQGSRVTEIVVPLGASIQLGSTTVRLQGADTPALPPSSRERFGNLVGRSVAMRELFAVLELASPTDATVLLEGESGTGKELAARAIHDHSERAGGPFVVLDCSALSEALLESHLYGHVKGAFTGADTARKGAFVEASGGTLFLDELGELPLAAQARLLRALEAQTVQPLGADRAISVDTRVVGATHRDLRAMVDAKQFRFDLYYRLAVVHAVIPPLRERPEDVGLLVETFYEGRAREPGPIEGANLDALARHGWPGNVRELRNVLERAWALSGPGGQPFASLRLWLQAGAPPPPPTGATEALDATLPFKDAKERWVDAFERRYLAAVFAAHDGNITHAADHAGINRAHFRKLLHKHGILG